MKLAHSIQESKIPLILWFIGFLLILPVVATVGSGRTLYFMLYLGLLAVSGFFFSPKYSFYFFLLSISIYHPTFIGRFAIHPNDIFFAIFFAAAVFDYILKARTDYIYSPIDIPFVILIIATTLSAMFAFNSSYSIVPTFRIITIFLAFRVMYVFVNKFGIRKVLLFYIYHVFGLSLINCVLFLMSGGEGRIFGPSWLAFETYSMTAIPMTFAFFLWSETSYEKFKYVAITIVILIALLATQSRAPMLAVILATPILLYFASKKMGGEKKQFYKRQLVRLLISLGVVIVLGIIFKDSFFKGAFSRFEMFIEALSNPKGTVYLRILLWTAAIKAFLANPFLGIGIGNFRIIGQLYPDLKFLPEWSYLSGMSTHNVVLNYLAETGLFGTLSLLSIAFINLKIAFRSFKIKVNTQDTQISGAILIAIIVFSLTILYMRAWTWGQDGYIMALLFALNLAWYRHLKLQKSHI